MKIANKKSFLNKKIVVVFTSLLIAVSGLVALDRFDVINIFPNDTIPEISQEPSEKEKKEETHTNSTKKESLLDSVKNNQPQSIVVPTPSSNANIDLSVTKEGNDVIFITKLKEQGFSEGQCTLLISANGKSVEQSAAIIYQPEYSTCSGFSVPVSSLGSGNWNIKLSVTPINGTTITLSENKDI